MLTAAASIRREHVEAFIAAELVHTAPWSICNTLVTPAASWLGEKRIPGVTDGENAPVLPMMPGMPERRTHDYARHGVTSLFAAFNIADATVISELHRRHRHQEFLKFLKRIDQNVPAGLDVHLRVSSIETGNRCFTTTAGSCHLFPAGASWFYRHACFRGGPTVYEVQTEVG